MASLKANGIITLTTDFGWSDQYVGSLKGVILSIFPKARLVDISHDISPYDVSHGAFILGTTYFLFPKGTVHVGVVDPGVGGERLPILLQTENYFIIGPDNGLFSLVVGREKIHEMYHLTQTRYFLPRVSPTFHGRDIFAPVAAHLSRGVKPSRFGPPLPQFHTLDLFQIHESGSRIEGRIISIDKFGNAITSLSQELFDKKVGKRPFCVTAADHQLSRISRTYSEVGEREPVLVFGSSGLLELALYKGSIATLWHLQIGQKVTLQSL